MAQEHGALWCGFCGEFKYNQGLVVQENENMNS